jgi:hypothetical protein
MKDAHKRYMNYKTNFILHLISINYFYFICFRFHKEKEEES